MHCIVCSRSIGQRYYSQGESRLCSECGEAAQNPGRLERLRRLFRPVEEVDGPWTVGEPSRPCRLSPTEAVEIIFRAVKRSNGMVRWEAQFLLGERAFEMDVQQKSFSSSRYGEPGTARSDRSQSTSCWFEAESLRSLYQAQLLQVCREGDWIVGQGNQENTSAHGDYRIACSLRLNPDNFRGEYCEDSSLDVSQ